jgi:hypothetical protein
MGPPPNVDLPAWLRTIDEVVGIGPERLAPTHFGFRDDVEAYTAELRRRLEDMAARAAASLAAGDESVVDAFDREVREEMTPYMGEERGRRYFEMFPPGNDFEGVRYYLDQTERGDSP